MKNKRLYNLDFTKLGILAYSLALCLNHLDSLRQSIKIYTPEDFDLIEGLIKDENTTRELLETVLRKEMELWQS